MHSRRKKPLAKRIQANLRAKWVQVILSMIALTLVVGATYKYAVKKKPVTDAELKKQQAEFMYMHCDVCFKELGYNKDLALKPSNGCKCKPGSGTAGYWIPTKDTVGLGGSTSVYQLFNILAVVESLIWLAAIVYMLGREEKVPEHYFVKCVHCTHLLRYRATAFDALVECPNCENWVRLPDLDDAKCEEALHEETAEKALGVFEQRLRESGHVFPGEELVADPTAQPGSGVQSQPPSRGTPPAA